MTLTSVPAIKKPVPTEEQHRVNGREPPLVGRSVEIELLYLAVTDHYEVSSTTNTNWYRPGDWLPSETVDAICKLDHWTVKIHSYELIRKVMDLLPKISLI